ncbi:SRPBCC family protein [Dactylosporangium vinaceum]|uniref:SRPBCC family protein n=1 Tax=Dactylosporangium vinaceum TaxID=53362 RepID=A0ABV5M5T5_9ACTN|nr:SRPBCC family protein [Dactylosporangium vinaceum]UAC01286.1 SRPBCC family protein [Dactylosporangium vinaceum]
MLTTIEIDRPPSQVYAYATDPARFPYWQPDVRRVEVHPDGRFTTVRRIAGADRGMLQQVTESSAPSRWSAVALAGPIRPAASITVEPLEGGARSRVTFTLDFTAHGPADLLLPLVRRLAARTAPRSYARLKALLEAVPRHPLHGVGPSRPTPPSSASDPEAGP